MNKESILVGIIGLLVGVVVTWATATIAVNSNNTGIMGMMGMNTGMMEDMMHGNEDMGVMDSLRGKTGDDFDKAFLAEMISHHQGAIDMAYLAKTNARHDEIKTMAEDIITTQTDEINQMQLWQTQWGYRASRYTE